jgi:hypothetical protein
MTSIPDFHKAHDEATSQNVKDWLLIKIVAQEFALGLIKAIAYLLFYPPAIIVLAIGICLRDTFGALLEWPSTIWEEGGRKAFLAIRALHNLRQPVLPVNRKVTLCKERPE